MKQINQIAIKQGGVPNARGACTHDDNSLGAKSGTRSWLTPITFEINRREQKKWLLSPLGRQRPALGARAYLLKVQSFTRYFPLGLKVRTGALG